MGGILGNDAWRRSNGGVWLPRAFGSPETLYGWCCCGEPPLAPCEYSAWNFCNNCGDSESEPTTPMPVVVAGIGGDCGYCATQLNMSVEFAHSLYYCDWYYQPPFPNNKLNCSPYYPNVTWWVGLARCVNPTVYFWYCHLFLNAGANAHNDVYWISEIFTEKPNCFDTQYSLTLDEILSDFPDGHLYCDYTNSSATIGPMTA